LTVKIKILFKTILKTLLQKYLYFEIENEIVFSILKIENYFRKTILPITDSDLTERKYGGGEK